MPAAARSAWPLSVALIVILAACHAEPERTAAPEPAPAAARVQPNVLLVIVDALRADRLGVNGAPPATTPVLDRLAAEGVNFSRAFAHSTWTKPSIATLLTSVYPSEHGLVEVGAETEQGLQTGVLGREFKTMAEAFWEGGYTTVGLVNQVHLRGKYGFDRGFERYKSVRGHGASALTCKFVDRLIAASDHRPFFGYVHYLDPHWPYDTGRQFAREGELLRLEHEPPIGWRGVADWLGDDLDPERRQVLSSRYDLEVRLTDDAIGDLLALLGHHGLLEETIVVFSSDHGEAFWEHGRLAHGSTPYDEVMRVPLIFRLPSWMPVVRGQRDDLVGLVDVLPTLLDLAGLAPLVRGRGRSLRPALVGRALEPRPVYAELDSVFAVRTDDHKLIEHADGAVELYDLTADPAERHDLTAGGCDKDCAAIVAALRGLRAELLAGGKTTAPEQVTVDAGDIEEMRALGYLD